MVAKVARLVMAGIVLVALMNVRPAMSDGGSFWPFSSEKDASAASKSTNTMPSRKVVSTTTKPEPSALDKIGTDTKDFFAKVGNTVTGKKETKKDNSLPVYPKNPLQNKDKSASGSWFSWLKPEEKKPTTVKEYLETSKRPELK